MNKPYKITIASILILSIALLGPPQKVLAQSQIRTFTGEQVLRGLLFGEAPVSQLFPEIWAIDQATSALDTKDKVIAFNDMKESVVSELKSMDATFLSRFGQEMQSGDQVRVQASLEEASQKTLVAMQNLGYIDLQGNPIGDFTGDALWVWIAAAAALVVVLAGAAIVAGAWVIYWYRFYPNSAGEPSEQDSLLYRDTLVNSMTEKLATE